MYAASIKGEVPGTSSLCDRAYSAALTNANAVCAKIRRGLAAYGHILCNVETRGQQAWAVAEILFECEGGSEAYSTGTARTQDNALAIALDGANKKCGVRREFVDRFVFSGCKKTGASVTCGILFECSISK